MCQKKLVRERLLKLRKNMDRQVVLEKSSIITQNLLKLDVVKNSETIMIYMSFRNEVDTNELFKHLLSQDKRVVLGRCIKETREIIPVGVTGYGDFEKGSYGILEPIVKQDNVINVNEIDVVIVPGVGFDRKRDRIGFGAGYYDRFLKKLRDDASFIAISYDEQIVDRIPTDKYDLKMDIVLTDKETIR